MKKNLIVIGAGGHAISCIDLIESDGRFRIVGLIGRPSEVGRKIFEYEVLGTDDDLLTLRTRASEVVVGIGQILAPDVRIRVFDQCRSLGYRLPAVVSPKSYVSPRAVIMEGSVVMHGAVVNAAVTVGESCIINSRALLDHGAKIGPHCHIATGVLLNGDVTVGEGTFVGSGSIVHPGVTIGTRCVIGMGQIVRRDVPSYTVVKHGQ
jgi:sugar O-acyltransferase (sialic acid O-acetyltransferase NeuD family)